MGSIATDPPLQPFHIAATGHSLNYLPEYIAHRHGFFDAQGLSVSVSVPQPWEKVLDEISSGTAAAALGGIWVPSMYHVRGPKNHTTFAQLCNRAPLAILQRAHANTPFSLHDTVGKTVLMKGSNGASVGLFFKMLLREESIDPKSVNYIQDLSGTILSDLFLTGMGDYLIIDALSAHVLVANHPGKVAVAFEAVVQGGDIPWSVYYYEKQNNITPQVLDAQQRFCAALRQGVRWILDHDAETFREELGEIFPDAPIEVVVTLTNLFRERRMWTSPVVDREGFERWQRGIADGGLVEGPLEYESVVDDGPALRAEVGDGEIKIDGK